MSDLFAPDLAEMIADAEREIALRRHVYPRLVANGKLKQDRADRQIKVMEAIVATLRAQVLPSHYYKSDTIRVLLYFHTRESANAFVDEHIAPELIPGLEGFTFP